MNESLAGRYCQLLEMTETVEIERTRLANQRNLWREIEARTPLGRNAWWVAFRAIAKLDARLATLDLRLARLARVRRLAVRGIMADMLADVARRRNPSDA